MAWRLTSVFPAEGGARMRELPPSPALRAQVGRFWTLEVERPPVTVHVVPDGLIDLVFEIDAGRAWVTGAREAPARYTHERPTQLLGVNLLPGTAPDLLGVSAAALAREWQPLGEVVGAGAEELIAQVGARATLDGRIAVLEAFLLARVAASTGEPRVTAAIRAIVEGEGDVRVPEVGAAAGASPRNLGRLFDAWVGLSPKRFARVVRAQAALRRLTDEPEVDLAMLAAELGFADQAHLTRELQALVGLAPTAPARRSGTRSCRSPAPGRCSTSGRRGARCSSRCARSPTARRSFSGPLRAAPRPSPPSAPCSSRSGTRHCAASSPRHPTRRSSSRSSSTPAG
jgi:AraC-like DNA-binding protein